MPATFLHGVETLEIEVQGQVIRIVKSSVVALVGIAPIGSAQALTLCLSATDDAQFGKPVTGFNIPKTLEIIRKIAGGCPILVVNVFDTTTHTTQVTAEAHTLVDGVTKTTYEPVGAVTVLVSGSAPAWVLGTDYTIDEYGNFKRLTSVVPAAQALTLTYKKLNAAAVLSAHIIGAVDGTTEVRTGMKLFAQAYNIFGFTPKVIASPGYSTVAAVATEMKSAADSYRGVALLDAPAGTTVSGAIAGRGVAGTINFNTSHKRSILLYPQLKTYDTATAANGNYPYSAFFAGMIVKNDYDNGYWVSPSNKEVAGIVGAERYITAGLSDASSEANTLNEAGIVTIYNTFGTGIRTWGNRNALYPSSNSAKNFINVQRTDDIVSESLELAALKYVDMGITTAFIDLVREEGNAFISALISRGALLPGSKIVYNPDDNSPAELAAGHVTFERDYMVPTPAERITFKSVLDISLYQTLK